MQILQFTGQVQPIPLNSPHRSHTKLSGLHHLIPSPCFCPQKHAHTIFMLSTYIFMYVALVVADCSVNHPPSPVFCPHT